MGLWCFPCGWVEWGEDVREAAEREAREEASIDVRLGKVLQVASNFHDAANPSVGVWFAAVRAPSSPAPAPGDDVDAVAWFPPGAPPPLAFPTDAMLLARLGATTCPEGDPGWSKRRSS